MPRTTLLLVSTLLGLFSSLPTLGSERGSRGFLMVRGEGVVAAENAGRLFTPGSVQKLLVTAAALHHLGPDYRVVTTVTGHGELADGVLANDLVVTAAADPTWNERFFEDDPRAPLAALARQLRSRGLRRVRGDLVVDTSRFPGRGAPVSRPTSELAYAFAAPASALAIDESSVTVKIAPGRRVGDPGSLRPLGRATAFEWITEIRTVSRERHERGTVDFLPQWGSRRVVVRGEYPVSEPAYDVPVAVPHPDLFAAEALHEALRAAGVTVNGSVRVATSVETHGTGETVLARIESPPLAEILVPILRHSHNWYAEMLLRILAAEVTGEGRDDEGLDLIADLLVEEIGIAEDAFVLDDASGLSPYDLLSPEAVVALLRWAWRQEWRSHYVDALAVPGRGTLSAWGRLPPLAAKTGTVRGALALAGYLEPGKAPSSGREPAVFAVFLDRRDDERPALRAEIAAWLRRQVAR